MPQRPGRLLSGPSQRRSAPSRVRPGVARSLLSSASALLLLAGLFSEVRLAQAQPALPEREAPRLGLPTPRSAPSQESSDRTVHLRAESVRGSPEQFTEASGQVELRQGDLRLQADRVRVDHAQNRLKAEGQIEVRRGGDRYSGRELELRLDDDTGFVASPTYFFELTGAGGRASRIDFTGRSQLKAQDATYTSCPIDGSGDPAWLLSAKDIRLDLAANEGLAEGAVLRFMGIPILALPALSFPVTSERKSGWLPPNIDLDTQSGLTVAAPYYWNIAPHLDATFTPRLMTRRGLGLDSEFRYLDEQRRGIVSLDLVANDALTGERRFAFGGHHDGGFGRQAPDAAGTLPTNRGRYHARWLRVSDDNYWKDFSNNLLTQVPRLLPTDLGVSYQLGGFMPYARIQRWQVLQATSAQDRIVAPYQRLPQVGLRWAPEPAPGGTGWRFEFETELNRFALPSTGVDALRPDGDRWHALGSVAHVWEVAGARITPKASINAATYRNLSGPLGAVGSIDGLPPQGPLRDRGSRLVPSLSLDVATTLERDAKLFGRDTYQTLEPRLLYVRTPFRRQDDLPNFDSAARDFNFESLYSENAFAGVDRVSDADQLTAGVTTRVFDRTDGGELLRLAVAQRLLFRDLFVTPDGQKLEQRFSDVLVQGSTRLVPNWYLDAGLQYSPEISTATRTLLGARFSPGLFRTLSANYRFTRGITEQVDFGWQWPLAGAHPHALSRRLATLAGGTSAGASASASACQATWYGVGRLSYSLRESRITDSLLGVELDSGCWIGRLVAERLSTGQGQATTRLKLQLELVGLSRLGPNPLQALKDNVPGYQVLGSREAGAVPSAVPQANPIP